MYSSLLELVVVLFLRDVRLALCSLFLKIVRAVVVLFFEGC